MNNWKRLFCAEYRAVASFRRYSYVYRRISKGLGYIMYNRAKVKYNFDIAPTAVIGDNFQIVHLGAIVIGRNVVIGDNVTIQSGVTLGMKNKNNLGMPKICNGVYLGTGAKVIGPVTVGEHSVIAANAVVISDVPDGHLAMGIPARVKAC